MHTSAEPSVPNLGGTTRDPVSEERVLVPSHMQIELVTGWNMLLCRPSSAPPTTSNKLLLGRFHIRPLTFALSSSVRFLGLESRVIRSLTFAVHAHHVGSAIGRSVGNPTRSNRVPSPPIAPSTTERRGLICAGSDSIKALNTIVVSDIPIETSRRGSWVRGAVMLLQPSSDGGDLHAASAHRPDLLDVAGDTRRLL